MSRRQNPALGSRVLDRQGPRFSLLRWEGDGQSFGGSLRQVPRPRLRQPASGGLDVNVAIMEVTTSGDKDMIGAWESRLEGAAGPRPWRA